MCAGPLLRSTSRACSLSLGASPPCPGQAPPSFSGFGADPSARPCRAAFDSLALAGRVCPERHLSVCPSPASLPRWAWLAAKHAPWHQMGLGRRCLVAATAQGWPGAVSMMKSVEPPSGLQGETLTSWFGSCPFARDTRLSNSTPSFVLARLLHSWVHGLQLDA